MKTSFLTGFFTGLFLSLVIMAGILGSRIASGGRGAGIPSLAALFPVSDRSAPTQGPQTAPIILLEFADFYCPYSRQAMPVIRQLIERFPGKIRREFHHFPQSDPGQTGSYVTHQWAACAQGQGKFWEFHNAVYALAQPPASADLPRIAAAAGINVNQLQDCVKSGQYQRLILRDRVLGTRRGVPGTPTFFINDHRVTGAVPINYLSDLVKNLLEGREIPDTQNEKKLNVP